MAVKSHTTGNNSLHVCALFHRNVQQCDRKRFFPRHLLVVYRLPMHGRLYLSLSKFDSEKKSYERRVAHTEQMQRRLSKAFLPGP